MQDGMALWNSRVPEYGKQWNEKFQGQHYLYYTRLLKRERKKKEKEEEEKQQQQKRGRVWTTTSTKLLAACLGNFKLL